MNTNMKVVAVLGSLSALALAVGCDLSGAPTNVEEMENVVPYAGQSLMIATAQADTDTRCPETQRIALMSEGDRLIVRTQRVNADTCGSPLTPDNRSYVVSRIHEENGVKIYTATSPLGAIWIEDQRLVSDSRSPWVVRIFDYESPLWPTVRDPMRVLASGEIEDQNLRASGQNTLRIHVRLAEPVSLETFAILCYSLMMDDNRENPLVASRDYMTYELGVVSDLPPRHVLAQLKAISGVTGVALAE